MAAQGKMPPKMTPMFAQYLGIKESYPDALLFYRMGDFYELFFDDAEIAARELQIALTSRNPNDESPVAMCGVPHHAVEGYLAQLMAKGYKVAICDQVEDPRQAKGLVRREVTRVLTPGTVVEDANLSAKAPNHLAALIWDAQAGRGGLAWIDVSTGEWSGVHMSRETGLWQWLAKLGPRELLLPEGSSPPPQYVDESLQITRLPAAVFAPKAGEPRVLQAQGAAGLEVLDLADKPELVGACGALLAYLEQTQKCDIRHLTPFAPLNLSEFCILDEVTERNLELFRTLDGRTGKGTLFAVLDHTLTPMGGRALVQRLKQPWRKPTPALAQQEAVAHLVERPTLRQTLREALDKVYDLERLSTRIFLGRASPKDFAALRSSLSRLPQLREALAAGAITGYSPDPLPERMAELLAAWDDLEDVHTLLAQALADTLPPVITEGGLFRQGYTPELDELMELTERGEAKLDELLKREREACGLPKLKLGHNKVFGCYFELPASQSANVPEHFVRRQTLVNSERFVTPELKELEDKLVSASEKRKSLEYDLFNGLRERVAAARPRFMLQARLIAAVDLWQALAEAAQRNDWTRPELHEGLEIEIRGGRHPVVEAVQGRGAFVPNDLHLDGQARLLLITGPNMAGKSTVLRQTAIMLVLAQMGSFVPASRARLGLADRVFSRVGASDNLAQGRSTFMVEMTETARILRQSTSRSLVILDEIGRGTSTFDGLALAWAVLEELARRAKGQVRTLFATHYHELTGLEGIVEGVRNATIAIREYKGEIIFLRKLVPGPSDRSYGIEVARLAGVSRPVIERAREVLAELERCRDEAGPRMPLRPARQTLLPGLAAKPAGDPAPEAEHPLLGELRRLNPDGLTPLGALNLLNEWKRRLQEEDA